MAISQSVVRGQGEAGCKKGRRSAAHFAHPPGPLFKMGSVFANVVVGVVVRVAVTLEEQAAAAGEGEEWMYAVNPKGLGAEAKDNIFAQFSGVISIHAHAN